jgi:RNA polymerase sigma-70 factor (ECF subfamily)
MLRVTYHPNVAQRLVVEGDLTGPYVNELQALCAQARTNPQPLGLDLSGVTFLDESGDALLKELVHSGVQLLGESAFLRELRGASRGTRAVPTSGPPRSDRASPTQTAPAAPPETRSERELLAAARRGEALASEELVRRFGPGMLAAARGLLTSDQQAGEALCEAFREAFEGASPRGQAASLERWLRSLALSAALRRSAADAGSVGHGDVSLPRFAGRGVRLRDEADETFGSIARQAAPSRELLGDVRACVHELPRAERTALWLCDIEGLSIAEASRMLGLEPQETRARLHRARQSLRSSIGRSLALR